MDKIEDKMWVLRICKERIPSSFEEAKLLIEYGLNLTETYDKGFVYTLIM